jgi:hypothetical protein
MPNHEIDLDALEALISGCDHWVAIDKDEARELCRRARRLQEVTEKVQSIADGAMRGEIWRIGTMREILSLLKGEG